MISGDAEEGRSRRRRAKEGRSGTSVKMGGVIRNRSNGNRGGRSSRRSCSDSRISVSRHRSVLMRARSNSRTRRFGSDMINMANLIRGCFYGSIFGDACGAPFELKRKKTPLKNILAFFEENLSGEKRDIIRYTDDSEMALCICASLRRLDGFSARDMAKTFTASFEASPMSRKYGPGIRSLLPKMKATNFEDPFKTASRQFSGSGSYGNGGGMRITPVALYGLNLPVERFNDLVCQVTAVTHTHPAGLLGALLQAHGIRRVIRIAASGSLVSPASLDAVRLVDDLSADLMSADLTAFVFGRSVNELSQAVQDYVDKLEVVKELATQDSIPSLEEVVSRLGNRAIALKSIPTALYVFLRCLKPMPEIPYQSLVMKCSVYATMIGHDTDTIGCMACALAGALVGSEIIINDNSSTSGDPEIPATIFSRIEGLPMINAYCNWLIEHNSTLKDYCRYSP